MTLMPLSEKLIKELMTFGLSGNEAKAYLALLQLKKANARAIARLANIPRQEIYRVLPRLEKLGMVETIIDKPTNFLATSPEKILSELIEGQRQVLTEQISELTEKKVVLENELRKVEGRSAGLTVSPPVHFALISGQHMVNEKIEEMLKKAKNEVLWIAPKLEIRRAVIYDRDRMLRECAKKNVKVRIITEIDEKNVNQINRLGRYCEIRHSAAVTSLATIVDGKELIVGSAVHPSESLTNGGLMHELWTNDSGHINIMKDFFEKVWKISTPAKRQINSMKTGKTLQPITIIQGAENVKKQVLDSIASAQSRLFIVSKVDETGVSLVTSQLETLRKRNISMRLVAVVDQQSVEVAQRLAAKIRLRFLKERPVSFLVTDSDCLFSSSPVLQFPHEMVWSIDQNTVSMFWALAEDIWTNLSEDVPRLQ
ncbi:MAG TPA: helix-turn-helix domain-containing protein [candidate division Zixibacteria bacterium]|nr:helix-turn-helix domain-containing protein [candidate division Zixibacteria bacterium]